MVRSQEEKGEGLIHVDNRIKEEERIVKPTWVLTDIWAVKHDGRGDWRQRVRVLGPTEKFLGNNER